MPATRGELFAGVTVAIVTPFRSGEIDWDDLGETRGLALRAGNRRARPVRHHRRVADADARRERARRRVRLRARPRPHRRSWPAPGRTRTTEAIRMTKAAKKAGANGTLQVGPYYNKPTQEGYFRHFAAIAEATDLPIVVYNIPGRTGSEIAAETIARMAEKCPTIVAVKEATGKLDMASQIAALCDVTILSGDDSLTLPIMSIGGKGVVSVVGNVVPRDMMALVKAFAAGQDRRSPEVAPQALPAVPRHARRGDQPDPGEDRDEAPRPRHRRDAPADVPAWTPPAKRRSGRRW